MALTNARMKAMIDTEAALPAHSFVAFSTNGTSETGISARKAVGWTTPAAADPYEPANVAEVVAGPAALPNFTATAIDDVITATGHGLRATDIVRVTGASLPTGLATGVDYHVRDVTANTFKLAATAGGAAIDLTTDGSGGLSGTLTHYATAASGVIGTADLGTIWIPMTNPDPILVNAGTATAAAGTLKPFSLDRTTVS